MIPRVLILLLLALLNLVSAHSFLRLAHASVDAPAVDIRANGTCLWRGVAYEDITDYLKVAPSTYFIEILPHLGLKSFYNATITLEKDKLHTILAAGTLHSKPASFAISVLKDTLSPPKDGQSSRLRLYNAVSDSKWIELRIKDDENTIVKKISYRDASDYVDIPSGRWGLEIWSDASDVSLYNAVNYFIPGGVYSLFAEGLVKDVTDNSVDLIIRTDMTYKFAKVRATHVSPDAPGVDIYLQDAVSKHKSLLFSDLKYGEFSAYKDYSFVDGTTIIVTAAGAENVVLSQTVSFQENTHNTILIYGLLSGGTHTPLSMQLVKENLTYPEDYEQAKLKFIHAIPNGPKLKIVLNGHTLIHSISYGMITEYKFVPNEYAKVDVISLVDGSKVISQYLKISGGNVWTAVLEGIIGGVAHQQPKILLQSDAQFDYFVARAIQASPDLEGKDVSILLKSGRKVIPLFSHLQYHDITNYKVLVLRDWTMSVLVAGREILVKKLNVNKHDVVTLGIVGMMKSADNDLLLDAIIIRDNNAAPASSTTNRLRVVHLSPTKIHFDYYLDGTLISSDNKFPLSTDYFDVASGDHVIEVKEHKGKASLLKDCFSLEGGGVNTIFIEGVLHGTNPQLFAYVTQDMRYQYYQFRLTHTSSDTGKVDVITEEGHHEIFSGVSYGETTPYKEFMLANSTLLITEAGKKDHILLRVYPEVLEKKVYTLAMVGMSQRKANRLDYLWLEDDLAAPSSSRDAKVRVIHSAPASAPVDIYFNNELIFPSMSYKKASDYEYLTAGVYKIDVFISHERRLPLLSIQTNLTGGEVATFILEGFNNSLTLLGFKDATYHYFNLRIAHAAPNVGQIGVLINNEMEFSHIPFTHISEFKEFTSGVKRIAVVTHLVHRRVLLRQTVDLNTEQDVTLLITGLDKDIQNPLQMNALYDNFTLPSADDKSKVRFIHAVPGAPNVDIRIDGKLIFEKVGYTSATDYIEIHEGVYDVDILKSGTSNRLLRLSQVTFVGGKVYSIFGEGTVGHMIGKISSDYYPPPVASLRVIQASPNLGNIDLTLNGSPLFPNLNYKGHSSYQSLDPGSYRVLVLPHNQVKPVYLEEKIFVERFKAYSYLITGEWNVSNLNHKLDSILVVDDNQLPGDEDIKIRFIHACVNCPELEVRANGVVLFDHVMYKDISEYQIMESSTYRLHVYDKHGGAKLQSFDLDLRTHKDKSAVYTLVATGHDINSLEIISLRDAGSKPPKPHRRKKRSKSGIIAMIVIFSLVAALLVVVGVWLLLRRRRQRGYSRLS